MSRARDARAVLDDHLGALSVGEGDRQLRRGVVGDRVRVDVGKRNVHHTVPRSGVSQRVDLRDVGYGALGDRCRGRRRGDRRASGQQHYESCAAGSHQRGRSDKPLGTAITRAYER
jgi:hypothetical protein